MRACGMLGRCSAEGSNGGTDGHRGKRMEGKMGGIDLAAYEMRWNCDVSQSRVDVIHTDEGGVEGR